MEDQKAVILYRLSKNSGAREAAYEKMLLENPALSKADYLRACDPKPSVAPPAGSPAGTPNTYSDLQVRVADAGQDIAASHTGSSVGAKAAVMAGLMAIAVYFGMSSADHINGTEPHTNNRQWDYGVKNGNWENTHHGQRAPYMKEQDEIDQKVSDEREDSKTGGEGLAGLLALGVGALGLYAIAKKK